MIFSFGIFLMLDSIFDDFDGHELKFKILLWCVNLWRVNEFNLRLGSFFYLKIVGTIKEFFDGKGFFRRWKLLFMLLGENWRGEFMIVDIGLAEMIGFDWEIMIGSWLFGDIFMIGLLKWVESGILLYCDHEI